ncbi:MAG: hypothetical protein RR369_03675, partial [Lachnospiraceae bacterium]
ENTVFKKDEPVLWKCLNCGYIHEGIEAPASCPACAHPQGYFEVFVENSTNDLPAKELQKIELK